MTIFPIVAVLIGGIFTLLGVWISQRGAASVVERTFEGQRKLARDVALWEYRKQQIAPYLAAAQQRIELWTEIHGETNVGDREKMIALNAQVTGPEFNSLIVTYLAVPDNAFRVAFQKFVDVEGILKRNHSTQEVADKVKLMRLALTELTVASERFIFLQDGSV